jgi:hypothetical protein
MGEVFFSCLSLYQFGDFPVFHVEQTSARPGWQPVFFDAGEEHLGLGLKHQFQETPLVAPVEFRGDIVHEQQALPASSLFEVGRLGQE